MEDFQSEIVLVHIESGIYYNMSGLAAVLLRNLQEPADESMITNWIQSLNAQTSEEGFQYLEWLLSEGILVKSPGQPDAADTTSNLNIDLSSDLWIYHRFGLNGPNRGKCFPNRVRTIIQDVDNRSLTHKRRFTIHYNDTRLIRFIDLV
jgi:hypothetical protein